MTGQYCMNTLSGGCPSRNSGDATYPIKCSVARVWGSVSRFCIDILQIHSYFLFNLSNRLMSVEGENITPRQVWIMATHHFTSTRKNA